MTQAARAGSAVPETAAAPETSAAPWPERSAYLRPGVLEQWDDAALARWAGHTAQAGVTAAVTTLDVITARRRDVLARHGITLLGSFTCYCDHRRPGTVPGGIRPVGRDGHPLPPREWYTGLVPGSPRFDDALVERLADEARRAQTDWVVLDFLRWPGHWELDSRGGGHPPQCSFDAHTMSRFAAWLGQATAGVPDVDAHPEQWEEFRVRTITDQARDLSQVIRDAGSRPAMFLVPVPGQRRRTDYGQDVAALAAYADLWVLMSYQQMLGLPARAILDLAGEASRASARPAVAMMQTTAAPAYANGWDWGPPLTPAQAAALAGTLEAATGAGLLAGTCFFPGEAPIPHQHHRLSHTLKGLS